MYKEVYETECEKSKVMVFGEHKINDNNDDDDDDNNDDNNN